MQNLWIMGAGRSAKGFFEALSKGLYRHFETITVCDQDAAALAGLAERYPYLQTAVLHLDDQQRLHELAQSSHILVSLLPPAFHLQLAQLCLEASCHFLSASYATQALKAMDSDLKKARLCQVNECGLDPGLDHVLTELMLDEMKSLGAEPEVFHSFVGGLPSNPQVNPWGYLFYWSPGNVVHAGKDGAQWWENGARQSVGYPQLFTHYLPLNGTLNATYEGYPNRDSLHYREKYQLENARELIRGTLRHRGYMAAWLELAQLSAKGAKMPHTTATWQDLARAWSWKPVHTDHFEAIGWGSDQSFEGKDFPDWLLNCLLHYWVPKSGQLDKVVFYLYAGGKDSSGKEHKLSYSFEHHGKEQLSAMSALVGYPLAKALEAMVSGEFKDYGVHWPFRNTLSKNIKGVVDELGLELRKTHEVQ